MTCTANDIVYGRFCGITRVVEILKLQQLRAEVVYVNARLERVFPRKREDTLAVFARKVKSPWGGTRRDRREADGVQARMRFSTRPIRTGIVSGS